MKIRAKSFLVSILKAIHFKVINNLLIFDLVNYPGFLTKI